MSVPLPASARRHNCLLLWKVKDDRLGYDLLCGSLAASTAMASRPLLVPV